MQFYAAQDVPFLLEDKLKEDGALYTKGQDWHSNAVFDGNLVTGEPCACVAAMHTLLQAQVAYVKSN
jgi:hypothetical protein